MARVQPAVEVASGMNTIAQSSLDLQPIDWLGLHTTCLHEDYETEMRALAALVRSVNARTMVEFGCRDGRTAQVLLHNVPTLQHYVGIDVPYSYQSPLPFQHDWQVPEPGSLARDNPKFELIIRDRGTLDLTMNDLPAADVVFIDGDHSGPIVLQDSLLARSVVRGNGLIIWHDYKDDSLIEVLETVDGLIQWGWAVDHVEGTWLAICRASSLSLSRECGDLETASTLVHSSGQL